MTTGRIRAQGRNVEYTDTQRADTSSVKYGKDDIFASDVVNDSTVDGDTVKDALEDLQLQIGPGGAPVNFRDTAVDLNQQPWQPDRFYESNEAEVFALSVAEGVTVVKVQADHGGNIQAAINAAQAAGPGSIVWFDVPYNAEVGAVLTIADGNPIQIFGYSRDPADTILKRAVAAVYTEIIRISAGQTMSDIMDSPEMALRKNRILIRDITVDGQNGASALQGFRLVNVGTTSIKHVTFENCVATGCKTYGFNREGLSTDPNPVEDYVYDNCVAYGDAAAGIQATGIKHDSGASKGLRVVNCKFYNHVTTGAYLRDNVNSEFIFERNIVAYNGEYGLLTENCNDPDQRSFVQDNVFHQNGWQIGPSNPCGYLVYQSDSGDFYDGLTIRRNMFYQNGRFQPFTELDGDDYGSGLKLKLKAVAQNLTIEDNDFQDNGHFGVHLHARGGSYEGESQFTGIVISRNNFRRHMLAGVGCDNLSGLVCDADAANNFWDSTDGAANAPTDTGYTGDMYTGAGHGGTPPADACLSSTPVGYKKEVNEGETRYPTTVTVTVSV